MSIKLYFESLFSTQNLETQEDVVVALLVHVSHQYQSFSSKFKTLWERQKRKFKKVKKKVNSRSLNTEENRDSATLCHCYLVSFSGCMIELQSWTRTRTTNDSSFVLFLLCLFFCSCFLFVLVRDIVSTKIRVKHSSLNCFLC